MNRWIKFTDRLPTGLWIAGRWNMYGDWEIGSMVNRGKPSEMFLTTNWTHWLEMPKPPRRTKC